jgi:hypothetical protein
MAYKKIEIKNPREINLDRSPYTMPNEIWSNGDHVNFREGKTNVSLGTKIIYGWTGESPSSPANGDMEDDPITGITWTDFDSSYIFYALHDKIYRVNTSGSHVNVTRKSLTVPTLDDPYTGDYDDGWTATIFNGALLFNNTVDLPQFYNESTSEMEDLPNWNTNERCGVIRPFKNYLIALDIYDTSTSDAYPNKVLWSDTAPVGGIPASWDTGDPAVQAGYNILPDTQGRAIDGHALGDTFFIYKTDAVWAMQFIGGNLVFSFRKVFSDGSGILAKECVTEFDGKHFVVGVNDVYIHDGTSKKSVISNKMRKAFYSQINPNHVDKVKCVHDAKNREITIYFPSSASVDGLADTFLIYNYEIDTWTQRSIENKNITHITVGSVQRETTDPEGWDVDNSSWDSDGSYWGDESYNPARKDLIYFQGGQERGIYTGEEGLLFGSREPVLSGGFYYIPFVERTGLDFGDDKGYKYINAIYPHFEGEGLINIYVGTQEEQGGSITWSEPQEFRIGEDYKVNFRESGRYISIRMESYNEITGIWALTGYSIEYTYEGRQ